MPRAQKMKRFVPVTVVLRPSRVRLPARLQKLYRDRMRTRGMNIVTNMFRDSAFSVTDVAYKRQKLYVRGQADMRRLSKAIESELTTKVAIKRALQELVTEILYSGPDTWMEGDIRILDGDETDDGPIELDFDEDDVCVQVS